MRKSSRAYWMFTQWSLWNSPIPVVMYFSTERAAQRENRALLRANYPASSITRVVLPLPRKPAAKRGKK